MRRTRRQFRLCGPCALATVVALAAWNATIAQHPKIPDDKVPEVLQTYLTKNCVACHGPAKQSGSLSLHSVKPVGEDRATWEAVLERVRAGEMPPSEVPRPDAVATKSFLSGVESELAKVACNGSGDPGRVTLRRLNRAEYNNTIRDLLALDFLPADDFPADDVGYGFDNIGDVLAVSPLLLEKYLAAAEKITEKAFTGEVPPLPPKKEYRAVHFQATSKSAQVRDKVYHLADGELVVMHDFSRDGNYVFRYRAAGRQSDKEPVQIALRIDGKEMHSAELRPTVEGKPGAYRETTLKIKSGTHRVAVAIANPTKVASKGDAAAQGRAVVFNALEIQGPLPLPGRVMPEAYRRIMIVKPGDGMSKSECAKRIVENFTRQAFRRQPRTDEVARLVKLVELAESQGDSFERGIQLAVQATLVSPHFLFKVEADKRGTDRPAAISEYELATRLSYFLWSSMPDDELFRLAERNQLRRELEPQVRRMLKDPKAKALGENFAGQWLQIRNLKSVQPDARLFPKFDEALRSAMFQETALFFAAVVQEDRSILDFLDADFTFVNGRLARHYNIPGVKGDEFRRVSLHGTRRAGVLTHASVLTVTSNVSRTSPVKRGKYILENLLNTQIPPPPQDAGELSEEKAVIDSASLRQRFEAHRSKAECATCHQRMDPLGFAFEHYDAIGAWRDKDGKFDIDPAGVLPDGRAFKDPAELRTLLRADHAKFRRCVVEKLLTYALGRGIEKADRCAVDEIANRVHDRGDKFSELVLAIVASDPFQKRGVVPVRKSP